MYMIVKANILTRFFDDLSNENALPRPFGVFYQESRFCYEDALREQLVGVKKSNGTPDLISYCQDQHVQNTTIKIILVLLV